MNDSTLIYARKMLNTATIEKDTSKMGKAYNKLAIYYKKQYSFDSAYFYFNKSKEKYLLKNDSIQIGRRLSSMSKILIDNNDYYEGETQAIEALQYLENNDSLYFSRTLNFAALSLRAQSQYKKALNYHDRSLKYSTNLNDSNIFLNSKGVTLKNSKNYVEALSIYNDLLKEIDSKKQLKEYIRIWDNKNFTAWLSDTSKNLELELLKAYKVRKDSGYIQGVIASHAHLMKYYEKKDKTKSISHAKLLYQLTVEQNNVEDRLEALTYLKKLSPSSEYIKYDVKHDRIYDSINMARATSRNKYAAIRYNSAKERKENLQLKAQQQIVLQKQKTKNIIYLGLGILTILSSTFLFFYLRTKHKKEKIQERHTTEKRLSKKLHDEVGNDLYYLLLQLQKISGFDSDHENLKILKGFDTVYHKIRDFSRDHKIETGEEYGDELLALLDSYGDQETKVITSELEPGFWSEVSPLKKEELYWVLKELLTNMKRHSQANIVAITFAKEKRKIKVNYIDDGIGMNLSKSTSKNGLVNVETRMKDIGGTITFDSKPKEGFKATIVFSS
ncbi:ATP-binding protein [Aquimarina sp. AU474]|uniref:tetratricopeptide repeat-containing sensor histidine kinase n=1 Tax=Aquimarina sp. AU474 TaxID=2108529 RepID=UPI001F2E7102|nr:ATP-binding protein [Aquimarina sp. AU474]